jgi:hypothetical protein
MANLHPSLPAICYAQQMLSSLSVLWQACSSLSYGT